jgi:hypothetical protein
MLFNVSVVGMVTSKGHHFGCTRLPTSSATLAESALHRDRRVTSGGLFDPRAAAEERSARTRTVSASHAATAHRLSHRTPPLAAP